MEELKAEVNVSNAEEELKTQVAELKTQLRIANRELQKQSRAKSFIENNLNVKMNMFRALASENDKQKRFLSQMMKNSVDYLLLLDGNLNVAYCSEIFLQNLGVESIGEIDGKQIMDVYAMFAEGETYEQLKNGIETAEATGETVKHDVVVGANDSQRYYRVINTPIVGKDGLGGFLIDMSDMTDIIDSKNEAEKANKSKSDFLATMSHEIRTPMNAVIGIAQIELQKDELPDEYATAFMNIYSSGNSLLGIINDILDMSKIESGKLELNPAEYDVPSLINDTIQLNVVRIGSKPIRFELDISDNLPSRMFGDELRLKQILNNIISNAIKYTNEGLVKLTVSHFQSGNAIQLCFAVADTGQGMKPEDKVRLFSEYSRFNVEANRTTEGTGLGLNIAKNLAEMMDGVIELETEYGVGSTFTVTVKQTAVECAPIGAEVTNQLKTFSFFTKQERRKAIRDIMPYGKVLVVDDVETNLYVAEGLLSRYKLQIETTESGFGAIEKVEAGAEYDIIFMDHMMPMMDGIETTHKLREDGYTGIIVALTANALVGNREMFEANGFDGFIAKPIDIRQLNSVLIKFVRDKYPEEAARCRAKQIAQAEEAQMSGINPKLLASFCRDAEKAVVTLRKTYADTELKLFTITAHAMKSALANISERELSEMAFTLEKAGLAGNREYIARNITNFVRSLERLIERFKPKDKTIESAGITSGDTAYLAEQLQIISTACEEYDDDAAYAAFERLSEKSWTAEITAAVDEAHNLLSMDSDFEGAAELIGKLIGSLR
jgi:signal transduction histidine kinase/CheY-like chemotaxis protein